MKKVIIKKFKSFTGKLFDSEKDCLEHEKLVRKINKIMKSLYPIPDTCDFGNGEGYIQQDKYSVEIAKEEILQLGREIFKQPNLSFGCMGRWCDDSNERELYSAWGRLSNIDNKYREWGQGYFAINPDKGVQKPYNYDNK